MQLRPEERLTWIISRIIEEFKIEGKTREAPEIFEVALVRPEISRDSAICTACFERGLYEFVRKTVQKDPKIIRRERTREERLAELNVPYVQRQVILKLGMDNVRCPLRKGAYIDLYGPERGTADEILSAAQAYDPSIKALQHKRALLMRLWRLVRQEERRSSDDNGGSQL
jgi:hypothetical protein